MRSLYARFADLSRSSELDAPISTKRGDFIARIRYGMNMASLLSIIADRRDGRRHSPQDLSVLAQSAAKGSAPEYQIAAWLMAAYLNPLSFDETAGLTLAMARSGETLDLGGLPKPWVDKHSTGGVGDKTTLVALPVLAACGLTLVKMSGRGLGITGGTVDKLASVPGFRLDLTPREMIAQAGHIGLALTGQTPRLAPADGALYALRDATATVGSIPLIVSSILSKKLAAGADTIALDVKCGSGAFMPDLNRARELARWLRETGERCGIRTVVAITDMDQPLGSAVGNALEVREAGATLHGNGPKRFVELVLGLCGEALAACGAAASVAEGVEAAKAALESGAALGKAEAWFEAQGASPEAWLGAGLAQAAVTGEVRAQEDGWVTRVDARTVGEVVVGLGGGRARKEDAIDPSAGVESLVEVGDRVATGQPWARIHASSEVALEQAITGIGGALVVSEDRVEPRPWRLG